MLHTCNIWKAYRVSVHNNCGHYTRWISGVDIKDIPEPIQSKIILTPHKPAVSEYIKYNDESDTLEYVAEDGNYILASEFLKRASVAKFNFEEDEIAIFMDKTRCYFALLDQQESDIYFRIHEEDDANGIINVTDQQLVIRDTQGRTSISTFTDKLDPIAKSALIDLMIEFNRLKTIYGKFKS